MNQRESGHEIREQATAPERAQFVHWMIEIKMSQKIIAERERASARLREAHCPLLGAEPDTKLLVKILLVLRLVVSPCPGLHQGGAQSQWARDLARKHARRSSVSSFSWQVYCTDGKPKRMIVYTKSVLTLMMMMQCDSLRCDQLSSFTLVYTATNFKEKSPQVGL